MGVTFVKICSGLLFCMVLQSCDDRFIRKSIKNRNDVLEWYYYSHIGNFSTERITLTRDGKNETMICESVGVVTDVSILSDTITIKIYPPRIKGLLFISESPVHGYEIVVDSSSTYEEYRYAPDGIKAP